MQRFVPPEVVPHLNLTSSPPGSLPTDITVIKSPNITMEGDAAMLVNVGAGLAAQASLPACDKQPYEHATSV